MAKVIVIAEQREGKLKKASFELIYAASQAGNETHAILLGDSVESIAAELGHYGASKVHVAQDSQLTYYTPDAYSKAILSILEKEKPQILLAAHTPLAKDLLPHISVKLDAGLASDCTSLTFEGDSVKARRPFYAGKATAEVEFLGTGPKVLTIRPNSLGTPQADSSKTAEVIKASIDLAGLKTKSLGTEKGQMERPDVTEASTVISGGRAMKNSENYKILEECADVIGAAVGASRAAVDAGFRPHRDQVGQTGKVVSPQLYIACGISGAIQHLAGMRTSKCIVAINTDPEAPIFQVADYGIVGDLFTIIPLLTAEFKKLKEA